MTKVRHFIMKNYNDGDFISLCGKYHTTRFNGNLGWGRTGLQRKCSRCEELLAARTILNVTADVVIPRLLRESRKTMRASSAR